MNFTVPLSLDASFMMSHNMGGEYYCDLLMSDTTDRRSVEACVAVLDPADDC